MLITIIIFSIINPILSKVNAQLLIVTYDPLQFNLTFSQPVPLPRFQLLFNEYPIKYTTTTLGSNSSISSSYLIQGSTQNIVRPQDFITQKYVLMFTEPLQIAGGSLNLDSFLLRAKKSIQTNTYSLQLGSSINSHYKYQNKYQIFDGIAIAIVCMVYFLAYTTLIGLNAYNFLSIYIYISLNSPLFTSLDYRIAYFLLFQPYQLDTNEIGRFIYICIPFILILTTFLIGVICRFTLRKLASRSGLWNYLYYMLTYKLFFITWGMMCVPLFANMSFIIQQKLIFTTIPKILIDFFIYFSAATIAFYSYFCLFIMNPQISQKPQSWISYAESTDFQMFEGIHLGIIGRDWKKRNFLFFVSILKIAIVIFVNLNISGIPNLLFQIAYLIYMFTLRPFKYDFYNYINIGTQIFVIVFYLFRFIVHLYMGISDEITTSTDITRILLTNVVFVMLIIVTYFAVGIKQFYQRIKSFCKNIKAWNRELLQAKNQVSIRKTKHSAFRRDSQETPQAEKKTRKEKKQLRRAKKISEDQMPPKQSKISGSKYLDQQAIIKRELSPKAKKEQKEKDQKELKSNKKTQNLQKPSKRIKQKSSLLQSISMSQETPNF